jgi:hypothetical protein
VLYDQPFAIAGGDYQAPSTTTYNGATEGGAIGQEVCTLERTALAATIDYNNLMDAELVEPADCLTIEAGKGAAQYVYSVTGLGSDTFQTNNGVLSGPQMNQCNAMCNETPCGDCAAELDKPCGTNDYTEVSCKNDSCCPCAMASVRLRIIERGERIPTSAMIEGQEYEVLTIDGGFCYHCFGATSPVAVGDLFVATDCQTGAGAAPCGTCLDGSGNPLEYDDCPIDYVLPVYRHTFEVRGRGHIGTLWQQVIDNFADGTWQYTEDTTDTTYRGFDITGYTTSKSGTNYVGDTRIIASCCDSPAWVDEPPEHELQGCQGCLRGLYLTYVHDPSTTALFKRWKSLPRHYFRVATHFREDMDCFSTAFTIAAQVYPEWLDCDGGNPPPNIVVLPEQNVSGCVHGECDVGGGVSGENTVATKWVAMEVGSGQNLFTGLTVDADHGVYTAGTPKYEFAFS